MEITRENLELNGWTYKGISPFTGKPEYVIDESEDKYSFGFKDHTFIYSPDKKMVRYTQGEFSTINKKIETLEELMNFYNVLKK